MESSSIVKWGYQDNFKFVFLVVFFYQKILRAQEALKRKRNDFHPLRRLCMRKIVAFVVYYLLVSLFVRAKSFRKKK